MMQIGTGDAATATCHQLLICVEFLRKAARDDCRALISHIAICFTADAADAFTARYQPPFAPLPATPDSRLRHLAGRLILQRLSSMLHVVSVRLLLARLLPQSTG